MGKEEGRGRGTTTTPLFFCPGISPSKLDGGDSGRRKEGKQGRKKDRKEGRRKEKRKEVEQGEEE